MLFVPSLSLLSFSFRLVSPSWLVRGALPHFNVTFLGRPNMGRVDAVKYITERAGKAEWEVDEVAIITNLQQSEAIRFACVCDCVGLVILLVC